MADTRFMKAFALLRRFVDWDLSRGPSVGVGNLTLLVLIVPWLAVLSLRGILIGVVWKTVLSVMAIATVIWLGFVAWRGWRLIRITGIRGDRAYDRTVKFRLSSDYRETESATETRRRRRNVR
jgi:hypothetical protein